MFGRRARLVLDHDLHHRRGSLGGVLAVYPRRGWRNTAAEFARPRRAGRPGPTTNRLAATVVGLFVGIGAGAAVEAVDPALLVAPLVGMVVGSVAGFGMLDVVRWKLRHRSIEIDLDGAHGRAFANLVAAALEAEALTTRATVPLVDRHEISSTLALGVEAAVRAATTPGAQPQPIAATIAQATDAIVRLRTRLDPTGDGAIGADHLHLFTEAVDRLLPPEIEPGTTAGSLFELDEPPL
jgi:hypothetical protein